MVENHQFTEPLLIPGVDLCRSLLALSSQADYICLYADTAEFALFF
jgi:hypothetical protein